MSSNTTEQGTDRPTRHVELTVNGERVAAEVEPRTKLSDFLRQEAGLRGVRVGCEHGVCGACTISYDGDLVKSCLLYAAQVDGSEVVTVEALDDDGELHPLQQAFHEEHALQCGFCTSGFLLAARDLLAENPEPTRAEIETALADNICRCTGYQHIYPFQWGMPRFTPGFIIGGLYIVMFGQIAAFGLSQLKYVDLDANRNAFIVGFALFAGLAILEYMSFVGRGMNEPGPSSSSRGWRRCRFWGRSSEPKWSRRLSSSSAAPG